MKPALIASCGMNCILCKAYLRDKNKCPGCRLQNNEYCRKCLIKNCDVIKKKGWKFCSTKCEKFPCRRLKDLDKRYQTKYGMSMIDNLKFIEKNGVKKFILKEKKKWIKRGKIFCVHDKELYKL